MGNFKRENSGFSRGGGFGRRDSGARSFDRPEMHQATCDKCGKSCEVPFRPTQGKPVFCSDCFRENGDSGSGRFESRVSGRDSGRNSFEEKQMFQAKCDECGNNCEIPFRPTQGKPVYCSNCFGDKKHNGPRNSDQPQQNSRGADYSKQLDSLNVKLDKILSILSPETVMEVNQPVEEIATEEVAKIKKPKRTRAPKVEPAVEEVI